MTWTCSRAYSFDRLGGPHARRLAWALVASAALHAWLALEVPAGGARSRTAAPVFTARLVPAIDEQAAPVVPPEGESRTITRNAHEGREDASRDAVQRSARQRTPDASHGVASHAEAASLALRDDTTYYPARELDVYPALLAPLVLDYPERALREEKRGRVRVMLLIDAAGRVDDITVVEAEPPGYFEDAARRAFESASFSGARRNGLPVRSRVLVHVDFDPRMPHRAQP